MQASEIIEEALKLKADERSTIADRLLQSLDQPDPEVDRIWGEEAVHRARAVREGRMQTHAIEDVLPLASSGF